MLCQLAPGLSRPSMMFLFVGSQICRWLPSDPSSRKRPCLKLGVVIARTFELIIWMLVLLQGTFTPLVHAHAGRTQPQRSGRTRAAGGEFEVVCRRRLGTLAFHALRTIRVKETVNELATIEPFNAELVLVS